MINVQVLDCNSGCPPPFGPERLPRQVFEDGPALRQIMRLFEQAPVISRVVV